MLASLLVLWGSALQAADPLVGDLDGDGKLTVLDLVRVVSLSRSTALDIAPQTFTQADLNQDGVINDTDAEWLADAILGRRQLAGLPLARVHETSPAAQETGVSVTRETILYLTQPLAENAIVDVAKLFGEASGRRMLSRVEPARDRRSLTLFFLEPLPGNTTVRVTLNGTGLKDYSGRDIDADGDGQPGGIFHLEFSTVSLTPVTGSAVTGRVFASELKTGGTVNQPLPGVTVTVDGREESLRAVTDAQGNFRLDPAPAGEFFVHIDGRTAPASHWPQGDYYPFVGKKWYGVAGRAVSIGDVFLPLVVGGTLQALNPDQPTTVRFPGAVVAQNPALADVSITVPAGALFGENGSRGGKVGIAPVPSDRLPGPLPPGVDPALVITIQTDGNGNFDRPVPACFPNLPDPKTGEVLPPGAKSALWSFNHDTGRFEIVGSMTVSDDGKLACTDPGVGILAPGWHFASQGTQTRGGGTDCVDPVPKTQEPGTQSRPPACPTGRCPPSQGTAAANSRTGDPVMLATGELRLEVVDLRIAGRGFDFIWERTYRSRTGPNTIQGNGWDHGYRVVLVADGDDLILHDGNGRNDRYTRGKDGRWTAPEFFRDITLQQDGHLLLRFDDGSQWSFHPLDGSAAAGKLSAIRDRNDNELTLAYNPTGQLKTVVDTLGRPIQLAYNPAGFLASITDFTGRQVRYAYYGADEPGGGPGDLKAVTSPVVTGTPNNNDFPEGKTTSYTYSKGFTDERLNHNLLTITDPRRNDPNDATHGEGPQVVNVYATTHDPAEPDFDRVIQQTWGGGVMHFVYESLLPSRPNGFAAQRTIVNDAVGNVSEHFFDARNRLVRLREFTGRAQTDAPTTRQNNRPTSPLRAIDPAYFETVFEWTDDSLERRIIHPNGNITEMVYEADINPRATPQARGNLRTVRHLPGTHVPAGDQAVIEERFEHDNDFGGCCGYGFMTRVTDGLGHVTRHEYDAHGNRIRTRHPLASVIEDWEFNEFGQMVSHTLPDNGSGHRRRDEFRYFDSGIQRGYLAQRIEDAGHAALVTRFERDAVGNVVRLIDPKGGSIDLVRNQLDQVVRQLSREVRPGSGVRYRTDFHYDANDNLVRQETDNRDADGQPAADPTLTTEWEYESLNQPTRKKQEVSAGVFIVEENGYDLNRNLILTRLGEATAGRQPANEIRRWYDERNRLFRVQRAPDNAAQTTTEYVYDGNGNLVELATGLENAPHRWRHTYDGYDRQVASSDPMGNLTRQRFDAASRPVEGWSEGELNDQPGTTANLRLAAWTEVFDDLDRRIRRDLSWFDPLTQQPVGDGSVVTTWEYAPYGRVTRETDDNGHVRTWRYDTAGRLAEFRDPAANTVTWEYDANGNPLSITETEVADAALGGAESHFVTRMDYDGLNRLIRSTSPAGHVREFGYDSRGNLTRYLDALRASPEAPGNRVDYEYDGLNRLVATHRRLTSDGTGAGTPAGVITTRQAWDDSSRLVAQADALGHETRYFFDPLGRMTRLQLANGSAEEFEFDVHGNPVVRRDAMGTVVRSQFDALNRALRREVTPGTGVSAQTILETYTWDGLSRMAVGENNASRVELFHDSLGRVTRDVQGGKTVASTYDGPGNELGLSYPGGRQVNRVYDPLDQLAQLSDADGEIARQSYLGPGRPGLRQLANGTSSRWGFDADRRISRVTHSRGNVAFADQALEWDGAQNKISRLEPANGSGRQQHFQYDSSYRLVSSSQQAPGNPQSTTAYTLDGVGNRLTVTGGTAPGNYTLDATTPEPNDASVNQYTTTPTGSLAHDANGNVREIHRTDGGVVRLSYDYQNRLVQHEEGGGTTSRYVYDVMGRRISRQVGNLTTRHYYRGWQEIEEQDSAGNTRSTFVAGDRLDDWVSATLGTREVWYHADDLGSIRQLTDSTGAVVEAYDYSDFGEVGIANAQGQPLAASALGNPWLFTGHRFDPESGLHDYRHRFLDPETGRFLTRDPLGTWGDPDNLGNAHTYVANRPDSSVDPLGLDRELVVGLHSFIKVDTYDANGKKTGQMSLHFMPAGLWGLDGTDWRLNRPGQDDWHNKHLNFSVKIQSSRQEDEALLAYWRAQSKDPKSKRWNIVQNCWWSAFSNYDVGIARDEHWLKRRLKTLLGPFNNVAIDRIFGIDRIPGLDPTKAYIAPEPDQGWIESGRRAVDNFLEGAEGVAQKVVDFFDDPKPALQGIANTISSWFSSPPAPAPAPRPQPNSPTGDIAPVTGSSRTR